MIIDDPNIDDEGTVNVAIEDAFDTNRIENILPVNNEILTGDFTRLNNILGAEYDNICVFTVSYTLIMYTRIMIVY